MADATKTKAPKSTRPTFLVMTQEAIEALAEKKGSSVQAIKTYIVEKYTIDPDTVRVHLKSALARGLEKEILIRPKDSGDAKGATGRFKINTVKATMEEKEKAKKAKEKAKKEMAKESKTKPVKKKTTTTTDKTKTAKSPKAKKTAAATKAKKPAKKSPKKTGTVKPALKTPKKTKTTKQLKATGTPKSKAKK